MGLQLLEHHWEANAKKLPLEGTFELRTLAVEEGSDTPITAVRLDMDFFINLVLRSKIPLTLKRIEITLRCNDVKIPYQPDCGHYHKENVTIGTGSEFKEKIPARLPLNVCPTINKMFTKFNYLFRLEIVTAGVIGTTAHWNHPVRIDPAVVLAEQSNGFLPFTAWRISDDITPEGNLR